MSRLLALVCATTLLNIAACNRASEEAPKPAAEQVAPPASVAPAAAEAAVSSPAAAMTAMVAKPAEPILAKPSKPASEQKPAEPVAVAPIPAAKPEAPAAKPEMPAAKPAVPVAAASPSVIAKEQALALAGKGNCLACHKIESKVVGPAWKDVGAKYKGDANAAATIATHIKAGGSFGWKLGNMPPRGGSKISDADVESLAGFIASLK